MSNARYEFPDPDSLPIKCRVCYALVPYFSTDQHTAWHATRTELRAGWFTEEDHRRGIVTMTIDEYESITGEKF